MLNLGRGCRAAAATMAVCATSAMGCNIHPLKEVSLDRTQEKGNTVAIATNRDVDVLFVIDNSGSMAEEQATLARNFQAFVAELEREDVAANYRIAVTTTDVGHRWALGCGSPENGKLQMTTCRSRPGDFVWEGGSGVVDEFEQSCASVCDLDEFEVLPSTVDGDPTERRRPWLERDERWTNIPDGITAAEAFSCVGPQGINGCGMEAPLEAMYRSLTEMKRDDSDSAGFMRPGAILAIVFVTDEVDCSARLSDEFKSVWAPEPGQPRPLWGELNQDGTQARSDVCWFAGVECDGTDGNTECHVSDRAVDGTEADPDDSVLFPLDRYVELVSTIESDKKKLDPNAEVLVAVIAGVPGGYPDGSEDIRYQLDAAANPEFVQSHGVAPGCSQTGVGEAAPPVRLREFAETFQVDRPNMFSVCEEDYSPALAAIGQTIADRIRPGCVEVCVADTDPTTGPLEPNCSVKETIRSIDKPEQSHRVDPCVLDDDGGFSFPEGADVCYRLLSDRDAETEHLLDDMSAECRDEGWNVELALEWKNGQPDGSTVDATCIASANREVDCPDLPG